MSAKIALVLPLALFLATSAPAQDCVECHLEVTPGIVHDWQTSRHAEEEVSCDMCHGEHESADDTDQLITVTAKTCNLCHNILSRDRCTPICLLINI